MNCPVCRNAMITLELADVEIDHCVGCGGIWLDKGELDTMIGDKDMAHKTICSLVQAQPSGERPRRCPLCDKKMEKVVVSSSQPPLVVDRCSKGEGLWFDRGELTTILEKAELDPHSKVLRLLADMFGYERH